MKDKFKIKEKTIIKNYIINNIRDRILYYIDPDPPNINCNETITKSSLAKITYLKVNNCLYFNVSKYMYSNLKFEVNTPNFGHYRINIFINNPFIEDWELGSKRRYIKSFPRSLTISVDLLNFKDIISVFKKPNFPILLYRKDLVNITLDAILSIITDYLEYKPLKAKTILLSNKAIAKFMLDDKTDNNNNNKNKLLNAGIIKQKIEQIIRNYELSVFNLNDCIFTIIINLKCYSFNISILINNKKFYILSCFKTYFSSKLDFVDILFSYEAQYLLLSNHSHQNMKITLNNIT